MLFLRAVWPAEMAVHADPHAFAQQRRRPLRLASKLGVCAIALLASTLQAQTTPLVVNTPIQCATSVDGSVVGTPNPLTPPSTSVVFSGTLPAATYYIEITWMDAAGHETLPSTEVQQQLTATGGVQVTTPAGMPATATQMNVYMSTATGTETLQGTLSGGGTYTQSTPLTTNGRTPPVTNATLCQPFANDAGWPTGTGYNVTLTDPSGNVLPGYPMQWQLLGPGNTLNLANGLPYYNGAVNFPIPLLARPYNHALQSISGPLSLTNYNLVSVGRIGVGTSLPGYGVDAEAQTNNTLLGEINASGGYLYGGAAPLNHVLLGNGVAYVDSGTLPYSVLSGVPNYYQFVGVGGTYVAQRNRLNFIDGLNVTINCADNPGQGRSDCTFNAATNVGPNPNTPSLSWADGANGSLNSGSNDGAGTVNVTTPGTGGPLFTINFGGTYSNSLWCVIAPEGFTTAVFQSQQGSPTSFQVSSTAATSSGTGTINYLCHQ